MNISSYRNYLMCLYEEEKDLEYMTISLAAVQTSTGDIIYDQFDDDFVRNGLDMRLMHIQPCELILPNKMSRETGMGEYLMGKFNSDFIEKIIANFVQSRPPNEAVRVERREEGKFDKEEANKVICEMYRRNLEARKSMAEEEEWPGEEAKDNQGDSTLDFIVNNLPDSLIICFGVIIEYLVAFQLEALFCLDCNFR